MKKIIAILLTVLFIATLTVSAFAADSPSAIDALLKPYYEAVKSVSLAEDVTNSDGDYIILHFSPIDKTAGTEGLSMVEDMKRSEAVAMSDITGSWKKSGNEYHGGCKIKYESDEIEKNKNYVVLHKTDNGTWETLETEEVDNGYIIFKTPSLSPFVVVESTKSWLWLILAALGVTGGGTYYGVKKNKEKNA